MEFRVAADNASDRRRNLRARLFLWGTLAGLLAIALFAVYGARYAAPQMTVGLVWLAALLVGAAIAGAYFVALSHAWEKVERGLTFALTDEELIRKSSGYPDMRIPLSEIRALYERHGQLVVERIDSPVKIGIPEKVEGFKLLRAELLKYRPITVAPPSSLSGMASMITILVCWAIVLWSKDTVVALIASAAGLSLLGWHTFRIYKLSRRSPKQLAIWPVIGLSWAGVALVIFFRLMRA